MSEENMAASRKRTVGLQLFNAPVEETHADLNNSTNCKHQHKYQKISSKLLNFVEHFSRTTTVHGLVHFMNRGLHFTERYLQF